MAKTSYDCANADVARRRIARTRRRIRRYYAGPFDRPAGVTYGTDTLMRHLFRALLFVALALGATAAAPPSPMQAVARRFLINFAGNRLDAAAGDFNEQMRATVTPEILAKLKAQFDRELGHFRSITAVREGTDGTFPLVEMTAQFEKAPALVQVTF